jgi:hypothetical protein
MIMQSISIYNHSVIIHQIINTYYRVRTIFRIICTQVYYVIKDATLKTREPTTPITSPVISSDPSSPAFPSDPSSPVFPSDASSPASSS